jgi:uncharacterized repeat protein (TIGR01451 family)
MNKATNRSFNALLRGTLGTLALSAAVFGAGTADAATAGTSAGASIKNMVKVDFFDASGKGLNGSATTAITKSASTEVFVNLLPATPSLLAPSAIVAVSGATQSYDFKVWSNANGIDTYIFDVAGVLPTSGITGTPALTISSISNAQRSVTAKTGTSVEFPIGAVTIISNSPTTVTIPFGTMGPNGITDGDRIMINGVEYKVGTTTAAGQASAYSGNTLSPETPTTISIKNLDNTDPTLGDLTGLTLSQEYLVTVSVTATADPTLPKGTDCFTDTFKSKTDQTKTTGTSGSFCTDFLSSNLDILKSSDKGPGIGAKPGDIITYTVKVTLPAGAAKATTVKVTDAVPVYTTLVNTAYSGGFAQFRKCDALATTCSAWAPLTNAKDTENANLVAGSALSTVAGSPMTFVLGTGQNGATEVGGEVAPDSQYQINYQVTVN